MNYNFNVEIATKIGVDEAIMLNNFVYWLAKNKANNKNFFDGNYWTFNSVRAYSELFPFWKESQIKRILKSLIDQNVLVVGNYNQNAYDRTNWYSLSSEYIHLIHWTFSTNGEAENSQPIPNNKPNNKTNNIDTLFIQYKKQNENASEIELNLVMDFIDYRKSIKDKIKTILPVEMYIKELKKLQKLGYKINDCIETMKISEWKTIKTEWIHKPTNNYKTNNNIVDTDEWSDGVTRCDPNEFKW